MKALKGTHHNDTPVFQELQVPTTQKRVITAIVDWTFLLRQETLRQLVICHRNFQSSGIVAYGKAEENDLGNW